MSGVFRNIDPPPSHRPASVYTPLVRGEDTLAGWRGGGVNSSEDARHCSVQYFIIFLYTCMQVLSDMSPNAGGGRELRGLSP
jgi:hypothetical protein